MEKGVSIVAVFVITILLTSSITPVYAPPPGSNPGEPIDDILADLETVIAELAAIREDTEDLQSELNQVNGTVNTLNGTINTIRGTVQESFIFELEIPEDGTTGGALQFILVAECAPEAAPCSLMSVKKIVTPDAGILPVYVLLCTDVLVCHILHGQDEISVGIAGGIAFGIGALADVEIDLEEPLISPIPINLLFASGLGEVSFSRVLVLSNLPGYEGTVKFIGEKPLDVTLTGAYIDFDGLSDHCFDADGGLVDCTDVADALLGDGNICRNTDLFPVPAIDDAIDAILAFGETEGFDMSPPEAATECMICMDGTLDCPLDIPLFTKSSPLQTCTMPLFGEEPECTDFEINVQGIVDASITQVVDDIDIAVGDVKVVVDDVEGFVDNLPAIQSTINTIEGLVVNIGQHIQQILNDLQNLEIGDIDLGGGGGSSGSSGGCFLREPVTGICLIQN